MFDKITDAARDKLDLISGFALGLDLGRVTILPASILPEGDGEQGTGSRVSSADERLGWK